MNASTGAVVSVILPTHNRRELFIRSLASVLGQTMDNIEVWVIDNACSDGTSEYLRELGDPRLNVIRSDNKLGVSAARNLALRRCRANFIAFQDDDDIWLPEKLQRQLQALEQAAPDVGLCLGGYIRLTRSGPIDVYSPRNFAAIRFDPPAELPAMSAIATPAWLAKRDVLERAGGFDEAMPARNDWELALRLSDLCRFVHVAEPLYLQDQRHTTSMALNEQVGAIAVQRILDLHGHRWTKHPRTLAGLHRYLGRQALGAGQLAQGRRNLWLSLRLHPLQWRVAGLLLLSLFGGPLVLRARALSQALRARKVQQQSR